jgi:hypothetical protein
LPKITTLLFGLYIKTRTIGKGLMPAREKEKDAGTFPEYHRELFFL